MRKQLTKLVPADIIHPEDEKLLSKMTAIPGMKDFLAATISKLREKYFAIEMYGDGINVTEDSYPELYSILQGATRTLGVDHTPEFSLKWGFDISMGSEGAANPRVMALSGAVDLLEEDELSFLCGHEIGHIMAGHKPFQNMLITFYTPIINSVPGAMVWLSVLRPMLLNWYRVSDYTADRAGLLACQSLDTALRAMIKMSGIPRKYYDEINPKSILRQAVRFKQQNSGFLNNMIQNLSLNTACVPWLVVRAAKLSEWYESGSYNDILTRNHDDTSTDSIGGKETRDGNPQ